MEKLELLKKLKDLEKTISKTEKQIKKLSIHIQPLFERRVTLEYTEYGTIITDDNGSFGTVEDYFIENEL
jgi:regulator of replication initiation timing